jgi:hypothetical protein
MGLILVVFAFVLFVIAALAWAPTSPNWYRLIAAGLACYMASIIFGSTQVAHLFGH